MNASSRTPVSVVIPALNEERQLPVLLESLLACTRRPLEIIVIDGRSEDRTAAVVEEFARGAPAGIALRLLTSPVRNVASQRNLGAASARHELLLFLDADTAVRDARDLDSLLDRFERGGYAAASCRFSPIERDRRGAVYYGLLYGFHKALERHDPYALGACIVTRRDVFERCGGFDPTIRVNEDAHYCRSASRVGRFGILPVTLGISTRRFRKHGYLRMGIQYVRIYVDRTLRGEARDDRHHYEFGEFQ